MLTFERFANIYNKFISLNSELKLQYLLQYYFK